MINSVSIKIAIIKNHHKMVWAGMSLVVLIAILLPSRYISNVKAIVISKSRGSELGELLGQDIMGSSSTLASSLVEITNSDTVLFRVIERSYEWNDRFSVFETQNKNVGTLQQYYHTKSRQDTAELLRRDISVYREVKSGIFSINVTSKSPQLAKAIADALYIEVDSEIRRIRQNQQKVRLDYISKRIKTLDDEYRVSIETLKQFAKTNKAYAFSQDPEVYWEGKEKERNLGSHIAGMAAMRARLESISYAADLEEGELHLLDSAEIPERSKSPKRVIIIFLGWGVVLGSWYGIRKL